MSHLIRRLLRAPMFTGVTLLTLAIGIGANTAIFSVLNGVLLRSLPYSRPDRLVGVWHTAPGLNIKRLNMAPFAYFLYREEGRSFQDLGLWRSDTVSVTGSGEPQELDSLFVTERTLPALGVQPILGRGFTAQDDSPNGPETVILAYGYWQRRFGGEASAIGQRLLVDGNAKEVVGVLPRDFRFMNLKPDLVLAFRLDRAKAFIGNFSYESLARLKDGVTVAQANADIGRMIPMFPAKFPPAPGMSAKMLEDARLGPDVHPLKDDVVGDIGTVLWVLMGTVGIVLFIACANVANLLLVRAEGRQHELAIRAALGASRSEVAREILLESVSLGVAGGVLGLGLAAAALRLLVTIAPANLPRLDEITIDGPVLLFALGVSLAAGVLFGLLPVMKYAGPGLASTLRQGGRTSSGGRERHRARSVLVVAQVALAMVLLVGSGLMVRTILALKQVQPGFTDPGRLLTLHLSIPSAQVKESAMVLRQEQDIIDKAAAIPGAASVSMTTSTSMNGDGWHDPIYAETRVYSENQIPPLRHYKFVAPGSFQTMGNPLLAGRDLTWTDIVEVRPVVVVSENLARELWGSPAGAIGKRVRENPKGTWREVVGVAGNTRDSGVSAPPESCVYWPLQMRGLWGEPVTTQRNVALVIRSPRTGSAAFLKEVQQAIWSVNPSLTIADIRTMKEIYERSLERTSFTLVMLTIAASMALLLGIVGIYGVISYSVSQRTREIGVRIALGAPQSTVRGMFVRHALLLTGLGVAIGAAAAVGLTQLMKTLLFGVKPVDPATFGAVALILAAAALAAGYLPARRATLIEPMDALRAE
jgi:putative ABC transport system permease protein